MLVCSPSILFLITFEQVVFSLNLLSGGIAILNVYVQH